MVCDSKEPVINCSKRNIIDTFSWHHLDFLWFSCYLVGLMQKKLSLRLLQGMLSSFSLLQIDLWYLLLSESSFIPLSDTKPSAAFHRLHLSSSIPFGVHMGTFNDLMIAIFWRLRDRKNQRCIFNTCQFQMNQYLFLIRQRNSPFFCCWCCLYPLECEHFPICGFQ